jgi:hypothetical protein
VALVRGRPGILIELRCDMAGMIAEAPPLTHSVGGERLTTPDTGPDLRNLCVAPAPNASIAGGSMNYHSPHE